MSKKVKRSSRSDLAMDPRVLKNIKFNDETHIKRYQQIQSDFLHIDFGSVMNEGNSRHNMGYQREDKSLMTVKECIIEEPTIVGSMQSEVEISNIMSDNHEGIQGIEGYSGHYGKAESENNQLYMSRALSNVLRHYAGSREASSRSEFWKLYLREYCSRP